MQGQKETVSCEQDIVYEVGRRLALLLNANPNYEARLSRNSPTEILGNSTAESLRLRVDAANSWGCRHFHQYSRKRFRDFNGQAESEGYVYAIPSSAYNLSEDILEQLSLITGLTNRGTFARPTLYVLRKTAMPAVLTEIGYITNPNDAALMNNNPDIFARGIYNGILQYYSKLRNLFESHIIFFSI